MSELVFASKGHKNASTPVTTTAKNDTWFTSVPAGMRTYVHTPFRESCLALGRPNKTSLTSLLSKTAAAVDAD